MRLLTCASLIILFSCILLACGDGQPDDDQLTSEQHFDNAQELLEQDLKLEAIVELKNALKKNLENAQASALLGRLYFENGEYKDADNELTRALVSGGDSTEVLPMLAQVLLSLGDFERLDTLPIAGLDPESRSLVQAAKGLSMIYRGNLLVAKEIIDTALQNEPLSPYAAVAGVRLSMETNSLEDALDELKEVVSRFPDYAPAQSLLGDIEAALGRPKQAAQAYGKAIQLSQLAFNTLLNRALMDIYLGDFNRARKSMDRIKHTGARVELHPGVQFIWGLIHLHNKQLVASRKAFFNVSEYTDTYPQTLYYLAVIYLEEGYPELALSYAYKFLGIVPASIAGAKLAAKLELGRQSYSKAEKLLLPAVALHPEDPEILVLLATAQLAQGRSGEAVDLLARIVDLQPESRIAQVRLGAGLLEEGSAQLGVETLQSLLAIDPGFEQADILIILHYLRRELAGEAIEAALDYQKRSPSSATAYNLLARAYLANSEIENAKLAFQKALELEPGYPDAGNGLAELAMSEKDFESARNYFLAVLAHNPDHMHTRMNVAASYAVEGREKEMRESLQDTLSAFPGAMEPRWVLVKYYMAKGRLEDAIPLFDGLTEEQKEYPEALGTQARFDLAASRYNQALVSLRKLVRSHPNVSQYQYLLAKAYAGLGDSEKLAAALEKTVELNPSHFYGRIAMARLALLSKRQDEFESILAQLKSSAPENLDVMRLEIISAQNGGDNEVARQLLEALFEQEPTNANVIALATHRQSLGDYKGAIKQLQQWVQDNPGDVKVREKLVELYGARNRLGGVVYQYRKILEEEPKNIVALNNLAWNLLNDDPDTALELAETAYQLNPRSSAILDTLAVAHLHNNNVEEAQRAIERARVLDPDSMELQFHEARIIAATGDTEGAIRRLNALLEQGVDFSEREQAQAYLQQLK